MECKGFRDYGLTTYIAEIYTIPAQVFPVNKKNIKGECLFLNKTILVRDGAKWRCSLMGSG
jgi:hypothetical protein